MIEIVMIEELTPGDVILIDGMDEDELNIVTVESIKDDLIIPSELGGMDYSPPDLNFIVRLCKAHERASLKVLSKKIGFK